jgi:hypothetical protein
MKIASPSFSLQPFCGTLKDPKPDFDDNLYHFALKRDFLNKHVRLTTQADVDKSLSITDPQWHDDVKNRITATALKSQDDVTKAIQLSLPPGYTWKRVYSILNQVRQVMQYQLALFFGLSIDHPDCGDDYSAYQFMYLVESSCTHAGDIYRALVGKDREQFEPDHLSKTDKHLHLAELTITRQLELVGDTDANALKKGSPFLPRLICIFEGICVWSDEDQKYHLIVPMSSLRSLYHECRDLVTTAFEAKEDALKNFLDQVIILRYEYQACCDIITDNSTVTKQLHRAMKGHDLQIVNLQYHELKLPKSNDTKKKNIVELTCIRVPKWKHDPRRDPNNNVAYFQSLPIARDPGCSDHAFSSLTPYLICKAARNECSSYMKHFLKYPNRPHLQVKERLSIQVKCCFFNDSNVKDQTEDCFTKQIGLKLVSTEILGDQLTIH